MSSRAALLQVLNPVVDLDRDLALYDAISVSKIEMEKKGELIAYGSTKIPNQVLGSETAQKLL